MESLKDAALLAVLILLALTVRVAPTGGTFELAGANASLLPAAQESPATVEAVEAVEQSGACPLSARPEPRVRRLDLRPSGGARNVARIRIGDRSYVVVLDVDAAEPAAPAPARPLPELCNGMKPDVSC